MDQSTQARFLFPLMDILSKSRFCSASQLLDPLRAYKDTEECARIREACHRSDEALRRVMEYGGQWAGRTEAEFFARLSYEMTALGLDEPGACICAGPHAADPHYTGRLGRIERGNCLLVDFGGTYQGYYSDMTRTFGLAIQIRNLSEFTRSSARPTPQQRRPLSWEIRCRRWTGQRAM